MMLRLLQNIRACSASRLSLYKVTLHVIQAGASNGMPVGFDQAVTNLSMCNVRLEPDHVISSSFLVDIRMSEGYTCVEFDEPQRWTPLDDDIV